MSSDPSSRLSLAEAEALYDQVRNCRTAEEATSLLARVNDSIKDLCDSIIVGVLQPRDVQGTEHLADMELVVILSNALKLLESREKALSARPSFSFRTARATLPSAETIDTVSAVKPSVTSCQKSNVSKEDPSSQRTICLSDGKLHIYGAVDTQVVRSAEELQGVGTVILKNLERCRVVLLGTVESTYMSNVKDCIIWIGISRASVILDSMSRSTVVVCCSQLRIANSHQSKFLVDTVTAPIIESSSGIVFAKNHVSYPGHVEHLEASGLKEKLMGTHNSVKDFSWHHDTPSPNWSAEGPRTPVTLAPENLVHNSDDGTGNTVTFNATDWRTLENL